MDRRLFAGGRSNAYAEDEEAPQAQSETVLMSRELPTPAPLSEESFFKARTSRVTFVNPPGYEHYAQSSGKRPDALTNYDRNVPRDPYREQQKNRWETQGERSGWAAQNRPLK